MAYQCEWRLGPDAAIQSIVKVVPLSSKSKLSAQNDISSPVLFQVLAFDLSRSCALSPRLEKNVRFSASLTCDGPL